MRNGFSFQAGAGGIALASVSYLQQMMKQSGVKARFVRGGSIKYLVELLEEGLTDYILDGQTFDLDGVRFHGDKRASCRDLSFHVLQLSRQGEFRVDGRCSCARSHRSGYKLQRQRGDALRRTAASTASAAGRIAWRRNAQSWRCLHSAIAFRSLWMR
jgi:hypothetical protein